MAEELSENEEMNERTLRMILSEVDNLLKTYTKIIDVGLHVSRALPDRSQCIVHSNDIAIENSLSGAMGH